MLRFFLAACLLIAVSAAAFAQTDIDVLYIQKTPLINYDAANGGWPASGSTVTWNAKVKNWGSSTISSFTCEWWMDGAKVQTNTISSLAPGETRNVTYQWAWQQSTHTLEFRADTANVISETTKQNNIYNIRTNAITVGSWVEQSLYDYFHAHQIELGDGANSFEDWCYRMVERWNELFSLAVWPVSPNGITDRVRIDKIVIVPNGTLPIHGGYATNNPDGDDKTIDLMWGHPYNSADCQPGGFWQVSNTGPFFIDYGEIHELDHARYLVDHYGFDISQDSTTPNVLVTGKNGNIAAGTPAMPYAAWNVVYYNKSGDIMGGSNHFGEYAAGAWNRKKGIRGPSGNQNSPGDIGVYLNDLPQNNYFKFVDNTGAPLVGATISIYQATGLYKGWYDKYFDNVADIVRTTDSNGTVNLGRCPFTTSGSVTSGWGYSNATLIIKVSYSGQEYFTFGEISDFGIEYWKGNTTNAYYTVLVPWGSVNTATPVAPGQWRQEIYNSKTITGLVDVKALDPNNVGGFVMRVSDRPISSGVGKDNFSCRFKRDIWFNKGTYELIMHTDDGGRLLIDGVNYINNWVDGGAVPYAATVTFAESGLHTVQMDYYDSGALALAALAIVTPTDTVPGPDDWKMEIYNTANLSGLVEVAACPKTGDEGFAMNWGDRGPSARTGADNFSVRFSRKAQFRSGTYRFTTVSEDGVRFYIDGQLKIDHWSAHSAATDTFQTSLSEGQHTLTLETCDISGPAQISLDIDNVAPDFDVTYISRTPRYDRYNVSYEYNINPGEPTTGRPYLTADEQSKQRWPKPGEIAAYTAHVKNIGAISGSCTYKWYFDGVEVGSGVTSLLAPGDEYTATYSRAWDSEQANHYIRFVADPADAVAELSEDNNTREDAVNGLSFRVHVWRNLYNWFTSNGYNYGAASFEDWVQRGADHLNRLLADAKFFGTPQGVPEHVRIDEIVIEPDSTADPDPSGVHAPADWSWDGRYGFTNALLSDQGGGKNYFETNPAYLATWDPAFIRSIASQLGLIDYGSMNITPASNLIMTTIGHPTSYESAAVTMNAPFISEHEAYALASNAHKRRGFTGEHLYDLPEVIRLRVLDAYLRPIPNAVVKIYQEIPGKKISSSLRFTLTADSGGVVTLPNRSSFGGVTTATGHTLRDNPFGLVNVKGENGVFFAVVTNGTQTDYQFIEIARMNIAAWLGYSDQYTYDLQTSLLPEGKPAVDNLYGVKMYGSNLGYAVGYNGRMLKYNGTTWQAITSPTTQTLYCTDICSDGTVIVGGYGTVWVNAGGGWVGRTLPANYPVNSCAALSGSVFFAGCSNGDLYRTTDSGANWTKITASLSTQGAIRNIKFSDSLHGILLPSNPPAYFTADGGITWTPAAGLDSTAAMLYEAAVPAADESWLISSSGQVYNSANGGSSWTKTADFSKSEPFFGLDMRPGGNGWAVGRYHSTYNTTVIKRFEDNRWYNWPLCTSGSQATLSDISLVAADEGWAVGNAGTILRLAGTNAQRSASCDSLAQLSLLPDGAQVNLTSVAGLYVSAVFADSVYLEKGDRSAAIKVYSTSGGTLTAAATASGLLATENGERVIRWGAVNCGPGSFQITPLAMPERSLGGAPNWQGTSNLALLVKTAGRITNTGSGWITLDDGSGLIASDGFPGVKVLCDYVPPMTPGQLFYAVTGVATTESVEGTTYRVIRATVPVQNVAQ